MEITFLGTGANECIPAFRCTCPVCETARKIGGKDIRQNSSVFIRNNNGSNILIDMPPQIISLLRNRGINDSLINNVLFTHRHEDHILGARYLFQNVEEKGFIQKERVNLFMPESAYWSMSGKFLFNKSAHKLNTITKSYEINFVKSYSSFRISELNITALETNHLKEKGSGKEDETLGYLIKSSDDTSIVYLLDAAKKLPDKTLNILGKNNIDLIIADCTYYVTRKNSGHSDIEGVIELKNRINPKKMIISHIGHQNLNHDDLELIMGQSSIEVGFDGMTIQL
jgi:phosphoribosyl 1,2-cyclic phosphate phosphodiesterase